MEAVGQVGHQDLARGTSAARVPLPQRMCLRQGQNDGPWGGWSPACSPCTRHLPLKIFLCLAGHPVPASQAFTPREPQHRSRRSGHSTSKGALSKGCKLSPRATTRTAEIESLRFLHDFSNLKGSINICSVEYLETLSTCFLNVFLKFHSSVTHFYHPVCDLITCLQWVENLPFIWRELGFSPCVI